MQPSLPAPKLRIGQHLFFLFLVPSPFFTTDTSSIDTFVFSPSMQLRAEPLRPQAQVDICSSSLQSLNLHCNNRSCTGSASPPAWSTDTVDSSIDNVASE